ECKEDPSRALVWQIKARRVVHDQEAKDIEYRDARLEMFGVPVAYTPYFSHPDPTVKRRSGFLAPSFGRGKDLGMAIQVPYYYVLSPQEDVTLAPRLTSTEGLILSGEHRRQFLHGQIDTRGSLTRDSLGDVRGHIDATGRFDLNETWRAGYQVARSSDDTYLRRYGFNKGASSLTTRPYLEGFFGSRSYALAEAYSFQGLRLTDDPGMSPVVLPYLQYNYVGDPDRHGGTWSLDSSALSLSRDEGADTRRLSSRLAWTLPYTAGRGDVYTLTASMRGDLYRVSDGATDNATTGRVLPEATLEWRYPFVRPGKDWQQTIEPVLVATAAPNGGNPSKLPNEDSRILEFNDTNLFQPNRFWGLDRVEGGPRVAYGAEYGLHGLKGGSAGLLLGQVYRPHVDEALQARSGLENKFSDYVGRLSLKPGGWFNLAYHFRLDRETLGRRYEELAAMVGPPRLRAYLDYVNTGLPPGSTNLRKREEAYGRLHVGLTPHWSVDAFHRHDLTSDGGPLSTGMSLSYDDECFTFITSFTNNHTYDRDYSAGSTVFVRLVFKTLGDVPLSF
ncbi:MAG: LPS assembly protein LptD, partial [Rhodospirillales bacterium]|nr:LPS assembly protein LptD [Rhodospirillales bacterium]